jgi:hypothetical protein
MTDSSIGNGAGDSFEQTWANLVDELSTDSVTGDLSERWCELQKVLIGANEINKVSLTVYDKSNGNLSEIYISPIHICSLGILAIYSEKSDEHTYRIIEGSLYGEDMGDVISNNASFLFDNWPEVESTDWIYTATDGRQVQLYRGLGLGAHLVTKRGLSEDGYLKYTTRYPALKPNDFDRLCLKNSTELQIAVPAYSVVSPGVIQKIEITHFDDTVSTYE